MIKILINQINK